MSFQPYLEVPWHIQLHAAAAFIALVLGPWALYQKRRGALHKAVGYVWVVAMAAVAISAFFIHSFGVIGPFSPLHLFAISTLATLWLAIRFARQGNFEGHRAALRNLYWYGLWGAGLANFLPGRTSNKAFVGGSDELGFAVIALGLVLILARTRSWQGGAGGAHVA